MKIKLLTSFASLTGSWVTGKELMVGEQISKEVADSLLKSNLAQIIQSEQSTQKKSTAKPKTSKQA